MAKHAAGTLLTGITLTRDASVPLHRQLYAHLREAILTQRLPPGARLPSTRMLAHEMDVSRYTVVDAFQQLLTEGYLEGKVGAGTFVTRTLPDALLHAFRPVPVAAAPRQESHATSRRSREQMALGWHDVFTRRTQQRLSVFQVGLPALESFPHDQWGHLVAQCGRRRPAALYDYLPPAGYVPLREAIAAYLCTARGVRCTAEQIIVVNGSQQGVALTAQVLLDPGEAVWMEEPGYLGAKGALAGSGARVVPVPLDAEGLDIQAGQARCAEARLAFVTPSHQFPLGVTMSLKRRLELLDWAHQRGAWIIEDDYDSEYRYVGRPLTALQGLDAAGRVIYVGTFSKVLFPALRLGYVVVPPDLVEAFTAARVCADMHAPGLEQVVLAEFMAAGHFTRHIRRMRLLYAERQEALVEAARPLPGWLQVRPAEAGMHLLGWLPPGSDDAALARLAAQHQVVTPPLSRFFMEPSPRRALVFGYTGASIPAMREGIRRLDAAFARAKIAQ